MQAFPLIRVRNLSANEVRDTEIHNARLYKELGLKVPDNINIGQSDNNSSYLFKKDSEPDISFKEAINNKI